MFLSLKWKLFFATSMLLSIFFAATLLGLIAYEREQVFTEVLRVRNYANTHLPRYITEQMATARGIVWGALHGANSAVPHGTGSGATALGALKAAREDLAQVTPVTWIAFERGREGGIELVAVDTDSTRLPTRAELASSATETDPILICPAVTHCTVITWIETGARLRATLNVQRVGLALDFPTVLRNFATNQLTGADLALFGPRTISPSADLGTQWAGDMPPGLGNWLRQELAEDPWTTLRAASGPRGLEISVGSLDVRLIRADLPIAVSDQSQLEPYLILAESPPWYGTIIRPEFALLLGGVLFTQGALLVLLYGPMWRLRRLAHLLPGLAHHTNRHDTLAALNASRRANARPWIADEVSLAHDAAQRLGQRLEEISLDLAERLGHERFLASISTQFVDTRIEAADARLQVVFGQIARHFRADFAAIIEFNPNRQHWHCTHAWPEHGALGTPVDQAPWIQRTLAYYLEACETRTAPADRPRRSCSLVLHWASGYGMTHDERGLINPLPSERATSSGGTAPAHTETAPGTVRDVALVRLEDADTTARTFWLSTRDNRLALRPETHPVLETAIAVIDGVLSRQRAEEQALRGERERAASEARLAEQRRLIAHLSHELRTPLTGILAAAQRLHETQERITESLPPRSSHARWLDSIRLSAEHLHLLVSDLLDLAKLESGDRPLELSRVNLATLLTEVIDMQRPIAEKAELHLALHGLGDVHTEVEADARRLRQILVNLISNAIKFSEPGGQVCVSAEQRLGQPVDALGSGLVPVPDGWIQLRVRDTGIGIPVADQPHIFERFRQGSNIGQREGSGLGMALVSELTQTMGGRLQFVSPLDPETGRGTEFVVDLPMCGIDTPEPAATARGLTVLLAEDNATNRVLLVEVLTDMGHRVRAVADGLAALDAWSDEIDIAILDHRMPHVSGLEVAQRLRDRGARHVIVILAADPPQTLDASTVDQFLSKPVNLNALGDLFRLVAEGRLTAQAHAEHSMDVHTQTAPTQASLRAPVLPAPAEVTLDLAGLERLQQSVSPEAFHLAMRETRSALLSIAQNLVDFDPGSGQWCNPANARRLEPSQNWDDGALEEDDLTRIVHRFRELFALVAGRDPLPPTSTAPGLDRQACAHLAQTARALAAAMERTDLGDASR